MTNSMYDAAEEVLGLGIFKIAETQRIQRGNRPRAHRKYITVNAPYPGCRTLERFNGRRVVMRLNLKNHAQSIANIGQARVFFPSLNQQSAPFTGQGLEPTDGVFIAAMLTPHHRISGQLRKIGVPSQDAFYLFEFVFR
jgi:hypothetical protein